MPTAYVARLCPTRSARISSNLGAAVHSAVLGLIARSDAALAQSIHDIPRLKPLTASNLLDIDKNAPTAVVSSEQDYHVRITVLSPELEALAAGWNRTTVPELEIDGLTWRVSRFTANPAEHPWAGRQSYDAIAKAALLRAEHMPSRWTLEFASPVTFRQRAVNQPLPLPELVFGNLLDRWNEFAPLSLPDDVRAYAADCMGVNQFDLRSAAERTKKNALQIGSIGYCTYAALTPNHFWQACIDTLAHFAFYSGVGAGTARGFGLTRLRASGAPPARQPGGRPARGLAPA